MPIEVGAPAPDFRLKDQNNQEVGLAEFRGKKNVLLVFYPLAFTGTCQGELCSVRDNLNDFVNDSVQVLAVSVDSPFSHKVWADQQGYDFPLLADFWPHGAVAQAYGVFNTERGFANRGTFIIDRDGVVRYAEHNDPGTARNQDAWRKALAAHRCAQSGRLTTYEVYPAAGAITVRYGVGCAGSVLKSKASSAQRRPMPPGVR
jgi:peroxiredoxin